MIVPTGFLAETHEMLCSRYPRMNKDYLLEIAEVLLSSCCWKVYTINDYGCLAPNLWTQMIAPSGDGKTLPIDNFLIPVLEELEKLLENDEEIFKFYLADYTKEGIIKHFSSRTRRTKGKGKEKKTKRVIYIYGLLCKDEATMFLEAASHKNYMADIIAVESKIYDGKLYRKITAGRGLEEVPKCFKANIAATTPAIYTLMKTDAFIQGGWNRYDMIVGNPLKPEDVEMLNEDFFIASCQKISEFEAIPRQYAEKLLKITSGEKIYIALDDGASKMWREYERKMKLKAIALDERDLRRGYLQRQAEKALKRGMLYTISWALENIDRVRVESFTDFSGECRTEKLLICQAKVMEMAINNQEELYDYWLKMLEERRRAPPESRVTTSEAEKNYFAMCMRDLKKEFGVFSRRQILKRTKWLDGDRRLTDNVNTAQAEGKLRIFRGDDARLICNQNRGDLNWFEERGISPSFKTPPYLYKWVEEDAN